MIRPNIGIDTSVLVRLVTGQPPDLFTLCVERLSALSAADAEIFASNQVIGEAYVALQHHYGVSKEDARPGFFLVAPLNGRDVLDALAASGGPGLFDRLQRLRARWTPSPWTAEWPLSPKPVSSPNKPPAATAPSSQRSQPGPSGSWPRLRAAWDPR